MSDPLAIYTQTSIGYADKVLNIKIGKSYDSDPENATSVNVF